MAIDKISMKDTYPLPAYNYRVTIDGSETLSFSEVSGLEIEFEYATYKHGYSWLMGSYLIRGQRKPINISLKRGVARFRDQLLEWLKSERKKDILVQLCDEGGEVIVSWEVLRALPYKLDAPSFSAGSNDVAIESLDLIAHDLRITYYQ